MRILYLIEFIAILAVIVAVLIPLGFALFLASSF